MSLVTTSIDIAATPEEVFDYAMAPHGTPEWVTIVRGVDAVDEGPLVQGFRMGQTLCLRGVPFHVRWVLAEVDRPHHSRWEGAGPARSRAIIENHFTPIDGGTRFSYRNEFKTPFGALGAVAGRALMGGIPEREATASLKRLKQVVEQHHAHTV